MFGIHVLEEEFHFKLLSLDTATMDLSDSPITVSEIPPTKESSGLSLFNRMGEQSSSQSKQRLYESSNLNVLTLFNNSLSFRKINQKSKSNSSITFWSNENILNNFLSFILFCRAHFPIR